MQIRIKRDKKSKKNKISIWIQKRADVESDIQQVISFYEKDIAIKNKRRYHKYQIISSDKPAIMVSLITTINELIPDIYFNSEDLSSGEEEINLLKFNEF